MVHCVQGSHQIISSNSSLFGATANFEVYDTSKGMKKIFELGEREGGIIYHHIQILNIYKRSFFKLY